MTACDMCGKTSITRARIEGTILSVCANCAKFGQELIPPKKAGNAPVQRTPYASFRNDSDKVLVADFSKKIRVARLKMGLNEEEAASKMALHKSTLLHYESGKLTPDEASAKRLERFYGISLHEQTGF